MLCKVPFSPIVACTDCCSDALERTSKRDSLTCTGCLLDKPRDEFNNRQQNRTSRRCNQCTNPSVDVGLCQNCGATLPWEFFPSAARNRSTARCSNCVLDNGRPSVGLLRPFSLGLREKSCAHCGARLFNHENSTFCCGNGSHVADFESYFKPPDKPLLELYASSWPLLGDDKLPIYDAKTNTSKLTGFSTMSRRFNALYALAQHEIQCGAGGEKELHLNNPFKPANIRAMGLCIAVSSPLVTLCHCVI